MNPLRFLRLGMWMLLLGWFSWCMLAARPAAASPQAYRARGEPVLPTSDGSLFCEAEEFRIESPGWEAKPWGENYYFGTFANTFLSRKAFLGAPAQCASQTVARIPVRVADAGRYVVLVRYEAVYRFETQFRVRVEQRGKVKFDRLYGARDNVKIWPFGQKLQREVAWDWGATENMVWEGHDALVDLEAGDATVVLVAGPQPEPGANRNVDLVLLTTQLEDVQRRIEKERYLPLDGLLTQQGDVWLRVVNAGEKPVTVRGGRWQEHSPYWVHLRDPNVWKPLNLKVDAGQSTDWLDVGGLMDTLNDGQWRFETTGPCRLVFGVRNAAGDIEPLAEFEANGKLELVGFADTRWSRRLTTPQTLTAEFLAAVQPLAARGALPTQTMVFAGMNSPELYQLFRPTVTNLSRQLGPRGYLVMHQRTLSQMEDACRKLTEDERSQIEVVSLGDEIGLPKPTDAVAAEEFPKFLQQHGMAADAVPYTTDPAAKTNHPQAYYWSQRYRYHHGIQEIKRRTDLVRRYLPNAQVGANYSPHHGGHAHTYLGPVYQWVTCFREDGMTLPWSEDYIWSMPVGSPQMNGINLDLFRAGIRGKPQRNIMYYVMPHWPGNTPATWRRLYHNALGHGMKMLNLFDFHPLWLAHTENYVNHRDMYAVILQTLQELARYEDIVQAGRVRPSEVALWFSETGDIWGDNDGSFAAAKRALYIAILHQQRGLDFVVEQDALDGTLAQYRVLFLTDAHVSRAASRRIAEWVANGGVLFATAGAGMWDEYNQPNEILRELLGTHCPGVHAPPDQVVRYIKQDLPWVAPVAELVWDNHTLPVFGAVCRQDGPAVASRTVGQGRAIYCRFLPGLTYFRPAIPRRPLDRGSRDDTMAHFIPTEFEPAISRLLHTAVGHVPIPVEASDPLVETNIIESPHGVLLVLTNWRGQTIPNLRLTTSLKLPAAHASLASGNRLRVERTNGQTTFTLDLHEADVVILR